MQVIRCDTAEKEHIDCENGATTHIDQESIEQVIPNNLRSLHYREAFLEIPEIPIQHNVDNQDRIAGSQEPKIEHFLQRHIKADRYRNHEHKRDNHDETHEIPSETKRSHWREHWQPFQFQVTPF